MQQRTITQTHGDVIVVRGEGRHLGGAQQGNVVAALQPIYQCMLDNAVFYYVAQGIASDVGAVEVNGATAAGVPHMHIAKRTHALRRHVPPRVHGGKYAL